MTTVPPTQPVPLSMDEAQQIMGQMADRITALEQQLQATRLAAATAATASRLKLPKPPETNGTSPSAINWCYKMETYLQAQNVDLNLPNAVTYAASFLKDSALNWWLRYQQEVAAGKRQAFANWAVFKQEFIDTFTPVKPDYDARHKLDRLNQTRSVFDYASQFNKLMLELPKMDEADRVHFFIRGLKPEVRMHVALHKPATLHDAVELAIQADSLLWSMHKGRKLPSFAPRPNFTSQKQPTDSGPTPMELGSMEQEDGGQAELYITEGRRRPLRCYYCNRAGHRIADCRQRKIDEKKNQQTQAPKPLTKQQQPQSRDKGGKPPSRRPTN